MIWLLATPLTGFVLHGFLMAVLIGHLKVFLDLVETKSFTLTAQDKHGIYDGQKIRRLTPLEWERLQGFPDNWTAGQSDSQRYKQLGNAVSVPVVKAIAERITETAVKPIPPTDKSVGILGVIL